MIHSFFWEYHAIIMQKMLLLLRIKMCDEIFSTDNKNLSTRPQPKVMEKYIYL